MSRPKLPIQAETHVLLMSRRRCCMCFGLCRDAGIKQGQIAHFDGNAANNSFENLAFLCLDHHDQYDGHTSQSKDFTIREIKHNRVELYDSLKVLLGDEDELCRESPWSDLWPSGKWTAEHDEALEFHTGTNRSQSVVLAVAQGPKTVEEINADIPPHDLDWTQVIADDVVERGWIQTTATSQPVRYELSIRGQKMLRALKEIPDSVKDAAWRRTWMSDDPA